MKQTIQLGFEIGTGEPVSIPVKHMAVCGQTQEAGKTTTLEALITRSGLRAVTFITKRGEASFGNARRIAPYFREQADWQFVASILEASRGERMKMERSFIIRASKGAFSLADVHNNVKSFLRDPKIRGLAADMYLCLDAYLDVVVPLISQIRWATSLDLQTGVNAIDLASVPDEMQHLVIKSCIDWVLKREQNTVIVIPEAWKFIPQGRSTPVKLSAESFIRQAAALHNFIWLDSQDLGGIEKTILRSVPLWIIGVQREANEIKRTLENIPAGISKPKSADIATQSIGQFYVCHGRHVIHTYVQPLWMSSSEARQIAINNSVPSPVASDPKLQTQREQEDNVSTQEAERLTQENQRLVERVRELEDSARSRQPAASSPVPPVESGGLSYEAIKARLISEAPALIKLLASRHEIEMTITRKTISLDESSLKGRVARLMKEGFFSDVKTQSAVRSALKRTGPDCNTGNLSRTISDFVRDGFLTDEGSGYREVSGMKVNVVQA